MKTSARFNNAEKPWLIIILFIAIYYALLYALSYVMEYPATYALIGVNGLVFLAIHLKKLRINDLCSSYYLSVKEKQSYRIMSSAFTHEHPLHILFNMYSLSNIGPALETLLGRHAFFASYLLLIIIAGRISVALKPLYFKYRSFGSNMRAYGNPHQYDRYIQSVQSKVFSSHNSITDSHVLFKTH